MYIKSLPSQVARGCGWGPLPCCQVVPSTLKLGLCHYLQRAGCTWWILAFALAVVRVLCGRPMSPDLGGVVAATSRPRVAANPPLSHCLRALPIWCLVFTVHFKERKKKVLTTYCVPGPMQLPKQNQKSLPESQREGVLLPSRSSAPRSQEHCLALFPAVSPVPRTEWDA